MHNVKAFLEEGKFIPPSIAAKEAGGGRGPELLHISHKSNRFGGRAVRYVVVEGTEKFKPDYWERVVCVFTTGTLPLDRRMLIGRSSMAVSRVLVFSTTDTVSACLWRFCRV
jgi:hypothetical protein